MSFEYDIANSLALVLLLAFVLLTYAFRVLISGRAHYERVDRQGGSVLLGKVFMEMGYWALEPLGRPMARWHISPNYLSWTSLVMGGISGVLLAYGQFGTAALCATVSAFMDTLDGMVARSTGVASEAGEGLDATIDRYVEFFFLSGLVIYYHDILILQIFSLMALMGSFMVSYSSAKAEAMHIPPPPGIMRRHERAFYLILGAALSPIPIPALEAHFTFPIPVGFPMVLAVVLIAFLANISAIERLYTVGLALKMREMGLRHETDTGQIYSVEKRTRLSKRPEGSEAVPNQP